MVTRVRIPLSVPGALAHPVRVSRPRTRVAARRWRRRGRRAQVAAVATILGLLLVVTFIANYLTTQLPNEMSVNDLNHEVLVENQVGHLVAMMEAYTSDGAVGAELTQPISLGSAGDPPFAAADGGTIGPEPFGSAAAANVALVGPLQLPSGGTPNYGTANGCTLSPPIHPTMITGCKGGATVTWNFTAGNGTTYSVQGVGGFSAYANFTTNNSLISVGSVGGTSDLVAVFGDHNTVFINGTGGASITLLLIGNNDTVTLGATGGASFTIFTVGNYDSFSTSANGAKSFVVAQIFGGHDAFSDAGGPSNSSVYFTGFNLQNPSTTLCPYDNVANTDTVTGSSGGNVYYNNTNSTNTNTTSGGWNYHYSNPPPSACPYSLGAAIAQSSVGTGFVVNLHNTYAPSALVAFDGGAVVYAQPGGIPILINPPPIAISGNTAKIWVPVLIGPIAPVSGIGTSAVVLRLIVAQTLAWPAGVFKLDSGSGLTMNVSTPFAAAWMNYFASNPGFAGHVSCTGPANVCSGAYEPGGPVGHVVIVLPVTSVTIQIAVFSVQLS